MGSRGRKSYMLSFAAPTTESSLLSSFKRERTLHRYAARVLECSSASLIIPRLYLSNFRIAADEHELADMGITHVVSVVEMAPEYTGTEFTTLHVPLEDTMQENILEHLPTTTEFIRAALEENENNKVLVHCMMGISRSATVVCAYLVATTNMNATEAIEYVRERRTVACPNIGFRQQLEKYTDQLIESGAKVDSPVPSLMEKIKGKKAIEKPAKRVEGDKAPTKKMSIGHWLSRRKDTKKIEQL